MFSCFLSIHSRALRRISFFHPLLGHPIPARFLPKTGIFHSRCFPSLGICACFRAVLESPAGRRTGRDRADEVFETVELGAESVGVDIVAGKGFGEVEAHGFVFLSALILVLAAGASCGVRDAGFWMMDGREMAQEAQKVSSLAGRWRYSI